MKSPTFKLKWFQVRASDVSTTHFNQRPNKYIKKQNTSSCKIALFTPNLTSNLLCWQKSGPLSGIPISGVSFKCCSAPACLISFLWRFCWGVSLFLTQCLGDQSAALVGQMCFQDGQAKNTWATFCDHSWWRLCRTRLNVWRVSGTEPAVFSCGTPDQRYEAVD